MKVKGYLAIDQRLDKCKNVCILYEKLRNHVENHKYVIQEPDTLKMVSFVQIRNKKRQCMFY